MCVVCVHLSRVCHRREFVTLEFAVAASRDDDVPVSSYYFVIGLMLLGLAYVERERVSGMRRRVVPRAGVICATVRVFVAAVVRSYLCCVS